MPYTTSPYRHTFVGFLYQVPRTLLYPLQSKYQLPPCSTQEERRHRRGAQLAEWGDHIVPFTLLTPKHEAELTVQPPSRGPDCPLHFTCHGCAVEINEVIQPENWWNRDWLSAPGGVSLHWWEKQSLYIHLSIWSHLCQLKVLVLTSRESSHICVLLRTCSGDFSRERPFSGRS